MAVITKTNDLEQLCKSLAKHRFITVDTEFLRDRTYYPRLCLVQLAAEGVDPVAVDPLAEGLDITALMDLMQDKDVIKVFHAARQDIEIFYNLSGQVPSPLFDTQVAAMVCGYGDQIGYNNIVREICGKALDKGAQFTDWSRRPLSKRQLSYALDDVTFLRDVFLHLEKELEKTGRSKWVQEEMALLLSPETYENPPEQAWRRIKIKSKKTKVLSVLKELAAWREQEAQRRNVPRNRVIRDEVLADIAVHPPENKNGLEKIRNIPGDIAKGRYAEGFLKAIEKGLAVAGDWQETLPARREKVSAQLIPTLEILKMLLRIKASENKVAARLIASTDELEQFVQGHREGLLMMQGWRYDVFGAACETMIDGKTAICLQNGEITVMNL